MFAQKPPSLLTKLGDAYGVLFITMLFIIGGALLSRHVPLAALLTLLLLPVPALLFLSARLKPTPCESQPIDSESLLLNDADSIEWKQIVGKDGETVEVGYIKKQMDKAKQKITQRPSLTNSG
jgi:hypothetical protein